MSLDNSTHDASDFPTLLVLLVVVCFCYFSVFVEERKTNRYY